LQAIRQTNEHTNVRKTNYSTNKLQVCYCVKLPQPNFPDYTNSLTCPRLWAFSPTLAEFPDISKFPTIPGSGNLAPTVSVSKLVKRMPKICRHYRRLGKTPTERWILRSFLQNSQVTALTRHSATECSIAGKWRPEKQEAFTCPHPMVQRIL